MDEVTVYRVVCLSSADSHEQYEWVSDEFTDYEEAYEDYKKMGGENDDNIIIEERTEYILDED